MGIWLSCGHREDDFDKHHAIITKESDIDEDGWKKAIGYKVVCEDCFKEYQSEGELFNNEEEAIKWLNEKEW